MKLFHIYNILFPNHNLIKPVLEYAFQSWLLTCFVKNRIGNVECFEFWKNWIFDDTPSTNFWKNLRCRRFLFYLILFILLSNLFTCFIPSNEIIEQRETSKETDRHTDSSVYRVSTLLKLCLVNKTSLPFPQPERKRVNRISFSAGPFLCSISLIISVNFLCERSLIVNCQGNC